MVALGIYWITVAILARKTQLPPSSSRPRWLMWILPLALGIDNVSYGLVGDHVGPILEQACRQLLSSALLAGARLAAGAGIAHAVPGTRRHASVASGVAGGALILGSGALLLWGWPASWGHPETPRSVQESQSFMPNASRRPAPAHCPGLRVR